MNVGTEMFLEVYEGKKLMVQTPMSPPQPTTGTGGAYASGVRGVAPAENGFWCIWRMKEHI